MRAERSSQNYTVNTFNLHLIHEKLEARMKRRFGKLDSANIILCDGNRITDAVAKGTTIFDDAVSLGSKRAINHPIF